MEFAEAKFRSSTGVKFPYENICSRGSRVVTGGRGIAHWKATQILINFTWIFLVIKLTGLKTSSGEQSARLVVQSPPRCLVNGRRLRWCVECESK